MIAADITGEVRIRHRNAIDVNFVGKTCGSADMQPVIRRGARHRSVDPGRKHDKAERIAHIAAEGHGQIFDFAGSNHRSDIRSLGINRGRICGYGDGLLHQARL